MKKNIYLYIGLIILIYSGVTTFIRNGILGFNSETLFLGILFIFYYFIKDKLLESINKSKYRKLIINTIKAVIIFGIAVFVIIEGMIILYPKNNMDKSDCIIVLGAGIEGENPSLSLKYRLDKAVETYKDGDVIIVSGGQGIDEKHAESYVMEKYLIKNGIPKENIIKEDKSASTYENFKYSKEKIEEYFHKDIKHIKVKIITTDFHSMRSVMLAKRNGYDNITVNSCRNVWYLTPYMYVREGVAFVKSYLLDR